MTAGDGDGLEGLDADELRQLVRQLQTALESRVIIEQAKGVLAERTGLSPDQAFDLLRRYSRRNRKGLHDVAAAVVKREGLWAGQPDGKSGLPQ